MTQKSHVLWCVLTVAGLVLGVGAVSVLGLNPSPPAKELVSLRWTQSHSCREDCFAFFVERQDGIPCLTGEYVQKRSEIQKICPFLRHNGVSWRPISPPTPSPLGRNPHLT